MASAFRGTEMSEQGEQSVGLWSVSLHFHWMSKTSDQQAMRCQPLREVLGYSILPPREAR